MQPELVNLVHSIFDDLGSTLTERMDATKDLSFGISSKIERDREIEAMAYGLLEGLDTNQTKTLIKYLVNLAIDDKLV